MIPEAAVEAAAKAVLSGTDAGHHAYKIAYAALEAAAPHMHPVEPGSVVQQAMELAWDDAYAKGRDRGEWEAAPVTKEPRHTNPYRAAT